MPWSLHFVFRGGPEKKGRKEKGPPARRKIPVARTPFRSACNSLSAHFRLERRCRIPPQQYRLRDAARASCAATGIFLMAGVIKPLTLRAASKVRRLKNKKTAHTVRPAPTPGPLILALTFSIHSDNPIKRNHSSAPAPCGNGGKAVSPRLRCAPAQEASCGRPQIGTEKIKN